jgi:hypothetical protein
MRYFRANRDFMVSRNPGKEREKLQGCRTAARNVRTKVFQEKRNSSVRMFVRQKTFKKTIAKFANQLDTEPTIRRLA